MYVYRRLCGDVRTYVFAYSTWYVVCYANSRRRRGKIALLCHFLLRSFKILQLDIHVKMAVEWRRQETVACCPPSPGSCDDHTLYSARAIVSAPIHISASYNHGCCTHILIFIVSVLIVLSGVPFSCFVR